MRSARASLPGRAGTRVSPRSAPGRAITPRWLSSSWLPKQPRRSRAAGPGGHSLLRRAPAWPRRRRSRPRRPPRARRLRRLPELRQPARARTPRRQRRRSPRRRPRPRPAIPETPGSQRRRQGRPRQARTPTRPTSSSGTAVRLRLDLGYDGSDFHGWASQPGLRTVQGELERCLVHALALDELPSLTVAGRTDAGVHARGQVVHLDVPEQTWAAAEATALRRLIRLAAPDILVRSIEVAPPGFDARFSAIWRRYTYRVCDDAAAA